MTAGHCIPPQFTFDETWRYVILPILALGTKSQFSYKKNLVNQVKNIVAKKQWTEVPRPWINLICYTLYTMSIDETKKRFRGKWCWVDCMHILTTLYGYKLSRPLEGRLSKSNAVIFASA
jgi:hypothetical protein